MKVQLICALVFLVGCTSVDQMQNTNQSTAQENIVTTNNKEIEVLVETDELKKVISDITKTPREANSKGETDAVEYISKFMSDLGYISEVQEFDYYKIKAEDFTKFEQNPSNTETLGKSKNIIFNSESYDTKKKDLIISAHYDTEPNTTGVIDNATGTVATLELAKIFSDENLPFNLKFVFFGCEENALSGSRYFVNNLSDNEKANILGVINIDMIGEMGGKQTQFNTSLAYPNVLTEMYTQQNSEEVVQLGLGGSSDEFFFSQALIPSMTITQSGISKSFELNDDIELLDFNEYKKTIENIGEFISKINLVDYDWILTNGVVNKQNIISNDDFKMIDIMALDENKYTLYNSYYKLVKPNGYTSVHCVEYQDKNGSKVTIEEINKPNDYVDYETFKIIDLKEITTDENVLEFYRDNCINLYYNKEEQRYLANYEYLNLNIIVSGDLTSVEFLEILKVISKF